MNTTTTTTTTTRRIRTLAATSGIALMLAACGGSDAAEPAAAAAPVTAAAEASATIVSSAESDLGPILANADGLTVYGFTNDTDGAPTCNEACADAWPPVIVAGETLPDGLDPEIYSIVARDDGSMQLKAGDWPLYLFAGDAATGDLNGQGSGDVWFAVTPDGGLVKDTPQGATVPTGDEADSDGY